MGRKKNVRSIEIGDDISLRSFVLSNDIFNGLKTAAAMQGIPVSQIFEDLGREYLEKNADEIKAKLKAQIELLDAVTNKNAQNG